MRSTPAATTRPITGRIVRSAASLLILLSTPLALADGGRLEINQACATGGGCFSGDAPGYPVEITTSGSYVLTSSLDLPADVSGIALKDGAQGSTIDLNGLAIRGPETCDGTPVTSCTGSSQVFAVAGFDSDSDTLIKDVTVMNGSVSGMPAGGGGVLLGRFATVRDIRVEESGAVGVSLGDSSVVEGVRAERNILGITLGRDALVQASHAFGNSTRGFEGGEGSVIISSASRQNGDWGIYLGSGSLIKETTVSSNGDYGINLEADSAVMDSAIQNNGDLGIWCQSEAAIRRNVLSGNASGSLSADCIESSGNLCDGDLNC